MRSGLLVAGLVLSGVLVASAPASACWSLVPCVWPLSCVDTCTPVGDAADLATDCAALVLSVFMAGTGSHAPDGESVVIVVTLPDPC